MRRAPVLLFALLVCIALPAPAAFAIGETFNASFSGKFFCDDFDTGPFSITAQIFLKNEHTATLTRADQGAETFTVTGQAWLTSNTKVTSGGFGRNGAGDQLAVTATSSLDVPRIRAGEPGAVKSFSGTFILVRTNGCIETGKFKTVGAPVSIH